MASVWSEDKPPVDGKKRILVRWRSHKLKRMGAPDWNGGIICFSVTEASNLIAAKRLELRDREVGLAPVVKPLAETLGVVTDEYVKYCKQELAENYYKNFIRPAIKSLLKRFGRDKLLDQITPREARSWLYSIKCGNTTRRMYYDTAVAFFNNAVGLRAMKENPMSSLESPAEDEGGRALTDPELEGIFKHAHPDLLKTGTFALNCGPRIREIMDRKGLDWRRVEVMLEPGAPMMRLWDALILNRARAMAAPWFGRLLAKQRKTARKVAKDCVFPINDAAKAVMGEPKPEGRVFPHSANTIQGYMVDARKKANVPDATFHWFRHTFATRYLATPEGKESDLIETGLWKTYDSLRRYIHPDMTTLSRRFCHLKYANSPKVAH